MYSYFSIILALVSMCLCVLLCVAVGVIIYFGTLTKPIVAQEEAVRQEESIVIPPSTNITNIIGTTNIQTANNGPISHELGDLFYVTTNKNLIGARFYKNPSDTAVVHTVNLWNASTQSLIKSFVTVNETSSGWQVGTFAMPIVLTSGTNYMISYGTSYWTQSTSAILPLTSADKTATMTAGYYNTSGIGTYPTNTAGGICYMIDPQFS